MILLLIFISPTLLEAASAIKGHGDDDYQVKLKFVQVDFEEAIKEQLREMRQAFAYGKKRHTEEEHRGKRRTRTPNIVTDPENLEGEYRQETEVQMVLEVPAALHDEAEDAVAESSYRHPSLCFYFALQGVEPRFCKEEISPGFYSDVSEYSSEERNARPFARSAEADQELAEVCAYFERRDIGRGYLPEVCKRHVEEMRGRQGDVVEDHAVPTVEADYNDVILANRAAIVAEGRIDVSGGPPAESEDVAALESRKKEETKTENKKKDTKKSQGVFNNFLNSAASAAGTQVGAQLGSSLFGRPPFGSPFPHYPGAHYPYPGHLVATAHNPYQNYYPQNVGFLSTSAGPIYNSPFSQSPITGFGSYPGSFPSSGFSSGTTFGSSSPIFSTFPSSSGGFIYSRTADAVTDPIVEENATDDDVTVEAETAEQNGAYAISQSPANTPTSYQHLASPIYGQLVQSYNGQHPYVRNLYTPYISGPHYTSTGSYTVSAKSTDNFSSPHAEHGFGAVDEKATTGGDDSDESGATDPVMILPDSQDEITSSSPSNNPVVSSLPPRPMNGYLYSLGTYEDQNRMQVAIPANDISPAPPQGNIPGYLIPVYQSPLSFPSGYFIYPPFPRFSLPSPHHSIYAKSANLESLPEALTEERVSSNDDSDDDDTAHNHDDGETRHDAGASMEDKPTTANAYLDEQATNYFVRHRRNAPVGDGVTGEASEEAGRQEQTLVDLYDIGNDEAKSQEVDNLPKKLELSEEVVLVLPQVLLGDELEKNPARSTHSELDPENDHVDKVVEVLEGEELMPESQNLSPDETEKVFELISEVADNGAKEDSDDQPADDDENEEQVHEIREDDAKVQLSTTTEHRNIHEEHDNKSSEESDGNTLDDELPHSQESDVLSPESRSNLEVDEVAAAGAIGTGTGPAIASRPVRPYYYQRPPPPPLPYPHRPPPPYGPYYWNYRPSLGGYNGGGFYGGGYHGSGYPGGGYPGGSYFSSDWPYNYGRNSLAVAKRQNGGDGLSFRFPIFLGGYQNAPRPPRPQQTITYTQALPQGSSNTYTYFYDFPRN